VSDRRLLLDGADLDELLARAARLGGRVVRAERVRTGLLGRSRYEVTVTVPALRAPLPAVGAEGTSVPVPQTPRRSRPAGLADLLAAAEAAERLESAAARQARATAVRTTNSAAKR